jgi:hypothetical protein
MASSHARERLPCPTARPDGTVCHTAEPLRLLADLHAASGRTGDVDYAQLPGTLYLTLLVAPLPPGAGGHYNPRTRTLTMTEALLVEDPRVLAAGLVHELQHALDFELAAGGILPRDCVDLEARAFESQARVTRAFWPDELPSGSDWERGLAMTVMIYEQDGLDGLRAMVRGVEGYRARCNAA